MTERDIQDMLPSIHWAILCYEYGKLDEFIASGNSGPFDEYYSCFWDVLQFASDFLFCEELEDYEAQKYYFGFESMSEYYRLCRDYCVQRGVRLKDNPYMIEAERFVENAMISVWDHTEVTAFCCKRKSTISGQADCLYLRTNATLAQNLN